MDWASVCTAIETAVKSASGLTSVVWENRSQTYTGPQVAKLSMSDIETVGIDDIRWADAAAPAVGQVETRVGWRRFGITVTVESQAQGATSAARAYAERLSTRIWFGSYQTAFDAVLLGLEDVSDVKEADRARDGRMVSVASVELRFSYTNVEADSDHPVSTIESVDLASTLTGGIHVAG